MTLWIIGHLLATCIGVSLGLIGGGGSVLALPILVYVMGIPPKSALVVRVASRREDVGAAIAMTLVIVGTVSLLGVIPHWGAKNVDFKTAFIFGSAGCVLFHSTVAENIAYGSFDASHD